MVQSSNYKNYARQTRALTEETAFSGGMMWTGNNIDVSHLKAIVNFNYDDTTGFLKTRNPLKLAYSGDTPLQFEERIIDVTGTNHIETVTNIPDLSDKQLIGAYNMCYTELGATDDWESDNPLLSKAGWLYVFGDINNEGSKYTCSESSLVCVYLDADGMWHTVHCVDTHFDGTLVGTTGIKPVLYDNTLYCTNDDADQLFFAYRIFSRQEAYNAHAEITKFYIHKQSYNSVPEHSAFEEDAKTLIDAVTLLEATVTGFNGARGSDMYTYKSKTGTGSKTVAGAYFKDSSGAICVTPRLGQTVDLHVVLNNIPTDNKGSITLSRLTQGTLTEANAVWSEIETLSVSDDTVFKLTVSDASETYNIVWHDGAAQNSTRYDSLVYTCTTNKLNTQLRLKEYALPTAKGSCLWNSHLVLWDVESAANCLFISETDNFYYMPVPHNVALFETDIISCIPYMGDLLVFTADRVYRLMESNEGTFTQEVVQNNMPLAREDAAYVRAVKNMVFFKSGKYYYMVVPKSKSLTGELSVAPVYKNLASWFDDPAAAVKEILTQMYPENHYVRVYEDSAGHTAIDQDAVSVSLPTDIYVEQDTVSILYNVDAWYTTTHHNTADVLQITDCMLQSFVLFVNYNTNLRSWTLYLEDTSDVKLYPAALTAARIMSFVRVTNDGAMYISTMQESLEPADGVRCLIDTGYRTLSNTLKKRFREVQVKLYSPTENITSFGSAFFVDGSVRRNYTHLEEALVAGDTGYISLAPVYDPNTFLTEPFVSITDTGTTVISDLDINTNLQGSNHIELSKWALDFSHFRRGAPSTVRIPVSGKGYAPRFVFMSPKCIALHLNEINWVYRIMNGR